MQAGGEKKRRSGCLLVGGLGVLVVGLLAFCALPNFLAERRRSEEGLAKVKQVAEAEQRYFAAHHTYYSFDAGEPEAVKAELQAIGLETSPGVYLVLGVAVEAGPPPKAIVSAHGGEEEDGTRYQYQAVLVEGRDGGLSRDRVR